MQRDAHLSLSDLLKNMADQFRAFEACEGQLLLQGEMLTSLIETLDFASEAAARLEDRVHATGCPPQSVTEGKIVPFPPRRERHHPRARRHSPWNARPLSRPGMMVADDDDTGNGGDAA